MLVLPQAWCLFGSLFQSACVYVCLCMCASIYLFIYLSIYLFIYQIISLCASNRDLFYNVTEPLLFDCLSSSTLFLPFLSTPISYHNLSLFFPSSAIHGIFSDFSFLTSTLSIPSPFFPLSYPFLFTAHIWLGVLRNRSCIWISSLGKFVDAHNVAFSSPLVGVVTEPFLYLVPADMQRFQTLLKALGVRERSVRKRLGDYFILDRFCG